jgi:hypothetical protein
VSKELTEIAGSAAVRGQMAGSRSVAPLATRFLLKSSVGGVESAGFACQIGMSDHISPSNIEGNSFGILHLMFNMPTTDFGFWCRGGHGRPAASIRDVHSTVRVLDFCARKCSSTPTAIPNRTVGRFDYHAFPVNTLTIQFSSSFGQFPVIM